MAKAQQAPQGKKTVTVTLVKSPIGFQKIQGKVCEGMGLRRLNHSVTLPDTPETRGMIFKVRHLVTVAAEGAEGAEKKPQKAQKAQRRNSHGSE